MEHLGKYIAIGIVGISCISVLVLVSTGVIDLSGNNGADSRGVNNITLILDYKNGTIKTFSSFSLEAGKTSALDALEKFCNVEYKEYTGGDVFVQKIDGLKNDPGHNWLYWVNNEFASIGASKYELQDNDVMKWVYVDLSESNY